MGVTTLKKICRKAEVTRWPFRKRTSIERLITRTQHFMGDGGNVEHQIAELQTLLAQREGLKVLDPSTPSMHFVGTNPSQSA